MLFHLLATFSAGICAAGLFLLGYRTCGRKAPRYLPPLAAGLAMIGYNVWDEYSWAGRTIADLPGHIEVVATYGNSAPWKPWTYAIPEVDRFVAFGGVERRPAVLRAACASAPKALQVLTNSAVS